VCVCGGGGRGGRKAVHNNGVRWAEQNKMLGEATTHSFATTLPTSQRFIHFIQAHLFQTSHMKIEATGNRNKVWRCGLYSHLMMEAVNTSETTVNFYDSTRQSSSSKWHVRLYKPTPWSRIHEKMIHIRSGGKEIPYHLRNPTLKRAIHYTQVSFQTLLADPIRSRQSRYEN
jgi:hypothetical protein